VTFDISRARPLLQEGNLTRLFIEELGWEPSHKSMELRIGEACFPLSAIADKCGFTVWLCCIPAGSMPDHATRLKIDRDLTQTSFEHLLIFAAEDNSRQLWMWMRRVKGKPLCARTHEFIRGQSGDSHYLRNRLLRCQKERGKDKFYSFYRYFLLRLFHEGFGQRPNQRAAGLEKLLGRIPYLNGGIFDMHELETPDRYGKSIQIPDTAFE
jgi:hypothetical protein